MSCRAHRSVPDSCLGSGQMSDTLRVHLSENSLFLFTQEGQKEGYEQVRKNAII